MTLVTRAASTCAPGDAGNEGLEAPSTAAEVRVFSFLGHIGVHEQAWKCLHMVHVPVTVLKASGVGGRGNGIGYWTDEENSGEGLNRLLKPDITMMLERNRRLFVHSVERKDDWQSVCFPAVQRRLLPRSLPEFHDTLSAGCTDGRHQPKHDDYVAPKSGSPLSRSTICPTFQPADLQEPKRKAHRSVTTH